MTVENPTDEPAAEGVPAESEPSEATEAVEQPEPEANTETPSEDATTAPEDGENGDTDDDSPGENEPKRKGPSRYQRMKAKIERLERELSGRPQPKVEQPTDDAIKTRIGEPPKEGDFKDFLAYERALTVYEIEKRQAKRELEAEYKAARAQQDAHRRDLNETFEDRVHDALGDLKVTETQFMEAVNSAETLGAPELIEAILESDRGPHIAYHLAKNPAKVRELNAMSPSAALRYIGRLEAQLSPTNPRKSTQAPAPVSPLKGGSSVNNTDPTKAKDMEEYVRLRNAQMEKNRA